MQVADEFEVFDMLNGEELERVVKKHQPDIIVPEIEAIRTERLYDFEKEGIQVVPSARAVNFTMNRKAIRDLAAKELGLKTAKYFYAKTLDELKEAAAKVGFPCVVKPLMSSSGKGQSLVKSADELEHAWEYGCSGSRGDIREVIIEEFIKFDSEITLLTVTQKNGPTLFCPPIGHVQKGGDYRESFQPAHIDPAHLKEAEEMAEKVTRALTGAGLWGVEFFLSHENGVYFSELSPRPHDTGMVTMASQRLSEFALHARAILGLPITQEHVALSIPQGTVAASHAIVVQGDGEAEFRNVAAALAEPGTDLRIFAIAKAFEEGYSIDRIYNLTKIDPWFLGKLKNIHDYSLVLSKYDKIEDVPAAVLQEAKRLGFSDFQIARFVEDPDGNIEKESLRVRAVRKKNNVLPSVKRINTVASENPELTNYLYVTYDGTEHQVPYFKNEKSVVVLGSGAYRIGSSVEFDWCSVNAVQTARKLGYKSIMINYNPETVSTDYDMCDRLYFDELSFERVLDVLDLEMPKGVIVSVGGQIPNNLAIRLHRQDIPVLGTSPLSIDRAENRHKFSSMLDQLGIDQPAWKELSHMDEVYDFVGKVGYPVLVRPSYVLSGAAMNVCYNAEELETFLKLAAKVSKEYPVVVSQFLQNAKEIEFDAVAHNGEVVEYAISEHVEFAGVHSGDATLVFPAQKIYFETARRIKKIGRKIAKELNISGPFNIQFLAKNNDVKVIECNLRASRSFPFVSKVLKRNFIETATRIMLDTSYEKPDNTNFDIDWIGVKASQFSFSRLHNADPVLGVDMSSTGEVGCIGDDFSEALLTSMISVGYSIPKKAVMVSSGDTRSKVDLLDACKMLQDNGYEIYATGGTEKFLAEHGVKAACVSWPDEGKADNVIHMISAHKFDLVINIPKNHSHRELTNGYKIRRGAIDHNIPLITNARLASAFIEAFCEMKEKDIQIKSWQEYKL